MTQAQIYTHICESCGNRTRVLPRRIAPGTTYEALEIRSPYCSCSMPYLEMARLSSDDPRSNLAVNAEA